jgi:hypothetical protein
VNSFKASALSARKHYYGALSQSSSDVPFIPSRLRLTLASGILTDNHVAQDCLPSTPGGSTPTHCCLSGFVVHSTFYCFRLIHQQNPPATSGIPTDHETRRHHADNLRHPLSLDCRLWNLVGLALQRQVAVLPSRVIPCGCPDRVVHPFTANTLPARNVPSQRMTESLLPTHRYHASPEGQYLTSTIMNHTFGQSARYRCPYLSSTAQQTGWMLDTVGRQ